MIKTERKVEWVTSKDTQIGFIVYFRDKKSIEQKKTWCDKTAEEAGSVILNIHPFVHTQQVFLSTYNVGISGEQIS